MSSYGGRVERHVGGRLAENVRIPSYGGRERVLKLPKKPSYNI